MSHSEQCPDLWSYKQYNVLLYFILLVLHKLHLMLYTFDKTRASTGQDCQLTSLVMFAAALVNPP